MRKAAELPTRGGFERVSRFDFVRRQPRRFERANRFEGLPNRGSFVSQTRQKRSR